MEGKARRERKAASTALPTKRTTPRQTARAIKLDLPSLVVGRELVGRQISVCPRSSWIKGSVSEFDEAKESHEVVYRDLPAEEKDKVKEWLQLGKTPFTLDGKDCRLDLANPTFSLKHTPKGDSAKNARVKIYWTAMAKWYQGVVEAYDATTQMHEVRFKDGDKKLYRLSQEAVIWMDIPALSSGTAISQMRKDECPVPSPQEQASLADTQTKVQLNAKESTSVSVRKRKSRDKGEKVSPPKVTRRQHKEALEQEAANAVKNQPEPAEEVKTDVPPQPSQEEVAEKIETVKSSDTEERSMIHLTVQTAGNNSDLACQGSPNTHDSEPERLPALVNRLQATKSASSSSEKEPSSPAKTSEPSAVASKPNTRVLGINVKVYTQQQRDLPDGARTLVRTPSLGRKRQRTESLSLCGSPMAIQEAQPTKKALQPNSPTKIKTSGSFKKPKQASRLCKSQADLQFAQDCEAIKGSRVSITWDGETLKGEVIGYTLSSRSLKMKYDDTGSARSVSTRGLDFCWLTPRAVSAGATADLHAAFQSLGACNAKLPIHMSEERPGVEVLVRRESTTPDGLHPARPKIDVPEPGASLQAPQQPSQASVLVSQAAPSGTQALMQIAPIASGAVGSLTQPNYQPGQAQVQSQQAPITILGSLQAASYQPAVQPSFANPGTGEGLTQPQQQKFQAPSVSRGPAAGAAAYRRPQQAPFSAGLGSALGWTISVRFRGDGAEYEGRIIAHDPAKGKHRVLYEDGEDEWLTLAEESVKWLKHEKGTSYVAGRLPEGMYPPSGRKDWEKWRIAVYWDVEGEFYPGRICDPDDETSGTGQLKILYDDGEERFENIDELICKLLEPPPDEGLHQTRSMIDEDNLPRKRGRSESVQRLRDCELYSQPSRQPSKKKAILPLEPLQKATYITSGKGRLLQFEDEEPSNPLAKGPCSPRQSMGVPTPRAESRPAPCAFLDPRGPPAVVRSINGLKHPDGYSLPNIKTVRMWLPKPVSAVPSDSKLGKTNGLVSDPDVDTPASSPAADLKLMLARTIQAKANIRHGMPLDSGLLHGQRRLASLPSSRLGSLPSGIEDKDCSEQEAGCLKVEGNKGRDQFEQLYKIEPADSPKIQNIVSAIPPAAPEHLTAPPSPFSGVKEGPVSLKSSEHSASPCTVLPLLTVDGCLVVDPCDTNQTSLSLPQTPSAKCEKIFRPASRSDSDILRGPASECCAA